MKSNLKYILKKELREVFRDKKSLMMMLIIPVLIPLIIIGMSLLFESQMDLDISEYNKVGFNYEFNPFEQELVREMNINATYDSEEDLQEKLSDGTIQLYVIKTDHHYTLKYNANNENSTFTLRLVESFYEQYKRILQEQQLTIEQQDPAILDIITISEEQIGENNFVSTYIVGYAFLFILMAITISATYPATDATAGEKERGTLETLLTFPIRSRDIILGKLFSVTLSSVVTGIVSLILAFASFAFVNQNFEIYKSVPIVITGSQVFVAILVIVMFSFFISGLCIAIASQSKTFKEAQSALTPLTFIAFFPGMIAFMIQIENSFLYSFIPFLNFSMILNDLSVGVINISCLMAMVISSIVFIGMVIWYIIRQYKSEKVLFSI
ncbi:MAG: ABC transporter permease [Bacilli bacterium]|nr:ABC transporter permease [Bacilli bacterium]